MLAEGCTYGSGREVAARTGRWRAATAPGRWRQRPGELAALLSRAQRERSGMGREAGRRRGTTDCRARSSAGAARVRTGEAWTAQSETRARSVFVSVRARA